MAVTLAASLVVAACSSSGKSSTANAGGSGTTSAASSSGSAAGAPLVIGEIETQTNGAATAGTVLDLPNTVKLWVAYVNSHGGINGHPVKVIDRDDGNDPAKSIAAVQDLVTNNHVIAILDGSGMDATWTALVTQKHIPVISLNQAGDGFQFQSQPDYFANGTTVLTILW